MAALMNSYQPEGITFSQHYPDGMSRAYEEPDIDPDEVVKSKPASRVNKNSYLPLLNESSRIEDWTERPKSYRSETATYTGSQTYKQGAENPLGTSPTTSYPQEVDSPSYDLSDTVVSKIPARVDIHPTAAPTATNDENDQGKGSSHEGDDDFVKVDLGASLLAVPERDFSSPQTESENEQEGGLGGSTLALLGDYDRSGTRGSRPTSINLGLPGDILCSPGGLVEVLIVGHKKCSVSLEDDCISWKILSRKSGE